MGLGLKVVVEGLGEVDAGPDLPPPSLDCNDGLEECD